MTEKIEIQLVEFGVLQLEKDDVVVLTAKEPLSTADEMRLRRAAEAVVPEGVNVMILTNGAKLSILRGVPPGRSH